MTGLVYDEVMCLHEKNHYTHPEKPMRIKSIYELICNKNLLKECKKIDARKATFAELNTVHSEAHIRKMEGIPNMVARDLTKLQNNYNSVYFNNHSYECALYSAGSVVELCDNVVNNVVPNGIAIVRPPGHHAEPNEAMGFCLFNNVAVAAKSMQTKYNLSRIVIIDWDVHHGNATQHMFESDPGILYLSLHRYDNGKFYPGGTDPAPSQVGKGAGIGRNVNIAWNTDRTSRVGDAEYIYAFNQIVYPMMREYDPQLIIVSAGFDCCRDDPLGGLDVTENGLYHITRGLKEFANGKIVIALEGGYNLNAISKAMVGCLEALLDKPEYPNPESNSISVVAINAVHETRLAHQPYWQFLSQYVMQDD